MEIAVEEPDTRGVEWLSYVLGPGGGPRDATPAITRTSSERPLRSGRKRDVLPAEDGALPRWVVSDMGQEATSSPSAGGAHTGIRSREHLFH